MKKIVSKIFEDILNVCNKDKILIICDKKTKSIAEKFLEYGFGYGEHMICIEIKEGKFHGEEPNPEIARLMLEHDISLLITTKSLSHTNARKKATAKGAKIISMPGITEDMLNRCVDIDYNKLAARNKKLLLAMKKAKIVRITSEIGTDISFRIYNNKIWYKTTFDKGEFHNIPMGEVFVSPIEGTANGVYFVDGSQSGVGKTIKPIKIEVNKGVCTKILGDKKAKQLLGILKQIKSKKAFNIAEFGIGTNPKAKITGNVLEDEKVLGTCHIALGNNYSFGGKVNVPLHLDGIIKKPTIYFNNKIVMKNGKLLI
jgi:leucyl aminopeptidase (aminopeptidase T)